MFQDDRRRTVDVDDGDRFPRFVDIVIVERPRRPDLAVELDLAFVAGDPSDVPVG